MMKQLRHCWATMSLGCWAAVMTVALAPVAVKAQSIQDTAPDLVIQGGAESDLRSVSFSADGNTLIAGSRDGQIFVWDVPSNLLLWKGGRQSGEVVDVAITRDRSGVFALSSKLVQVDDYNKLAVTEISRWNLASSQRDDLISGNDNVIGPDQLVLSRDDRRLMAAGYGADAFLATINVGAKQAITLAGPGDFPATSSISRGVADAKPYNTIEGIIDGGRLVAVKQRLYGEGAIWDRTTATKLFTYDAGLATDDPQSHDEADARRTFLSASSDLSVVATFDGQLKLILLDGRTGKTIFIERNFAGALDRAIAVSPDGAYVAYTQLISPGNGSAEQVVIWSRAANKIVHAIPIGNNNTYGVGGLAFSSDSRRLAVADKEVRIWDPVSGALEQSLSARRQEAIVTAADLSNDRRALVLSGSKAGRPLLQRIDLVGGGVTNFSGHDTPVADFVLLPGDRREMVASVGSGGKLLLHDALTGALLDQYVIPNINKFDTLKSIAASPLGKVLAVTINRSSSSPQTDIVRVENGKFLTLNQCTLGASVARFLDERRLLLGRTNKGADQEWNASPDDLRDEAFAAEVDIGVQDPDGTCRWNRRLVRQVYAATEVKGLVPLKNGSTLVGVRFGATGSNQPSRVLFHNWAADDFDILASSSGPPFLKLMQNDGLSSMDVSGDGSILIGLESGKGAVILQTADGSARRIATGGDTVRLARFVNGGKGFLTVSQDGRIGIFQVNEQGPAIQIFSIGAHDDYLIAAAGGHYRSTKGQVNELAFRFETDVYPFRQFDLQLNRPDIVFDTLSKTLSVDDPAAKIRYAKAVAQRFALLGIAPPQANGISRLRPAPDLAEPLPLRTTEATVAIRLRGAPAAEFAALHIRVNGVPTPQVSGSTDRDGAIPVSLTPGLNTIRISTIDASGTESMSRIVRVERTDRPQRTLHVVAIGVSRYRDASRNLTYAAKDANDLTVMMKGLTKAGRFDAVRTLELTDERAVAGLTAEVGKFISGSQVQDTVVIFFAGHGLIARDGSYRLATHDTDFKDADRTALAFDALIGSFATGRAQNRLMLIDACHSGELEPQSVALTSATGGTEGGVRVRPPAGARATVLSGREPPTDTSFRDMKEMFTDARNHGGATVIASSSASQFSYEGAQWRNGVFTYAVKSALADGEADRDRDGNIRISELRDFVEGRVAELTRSAQKPIVRFENSENDFSIAPGVPNQ